MKRVLGLVSVLVSVVVAGGVRLPASAAPVVGCDDYQSLVAADGPVAYWQFDSADPLADSAGAFPLSEINTFSSPAVVPAEDDGSLTIDSLGSIAVAADGSDSLFPNGDFTVEGWLRADNNEWDVIDLGQGVTITWNNFDGAKLVQATARTENGAVTVESDFFFDDFMPEHVVFTREADLFTLYLNGEVQDGQFVEGSTAWGVGQQEFSITNTAPFSVTGVDYDEFAIYDSALTASEVLDHFDAGSCRSEIVFTATQVIGCDEENGVIDSNLCPGLGPDSGLSNLGDYRVRLTFEDGTTTTIGGSRNDFGDFRGGVFYQAIYDGPVAGATTPIVVEVFDEDLGDDDPIDINPDDGALSITIDFDLATGSWSWPQASRANQHWTRGDGDTELLSNGGHPAILAFDISNLAPNPLIDASTSGDRDGDGLLDGWERWGLELPDVTVDNAVTRPAVQLSTAIDPVWGAADVEVPDIFVENDWLSDGTTSAVPVFDARNGDTYAEIVQAFAVAPTSMNLWIDTGTLTSGGPYAGPSGQVVVNATGDFGVDLGGGNEVVLDQGPLAGVAEVCGVREGEFYDVKDLHFDPNRRWVFRYAITGSDSVMPSGVDCPRGGQAEIGGNDILNLRGDAVVMMHELGHSLGLRHGGDENTNCKPNYQSVMNYAYDRQLGIQTTSAFLYDFSPARLSNGTRTELMPDIVEDDLDEREILDPNNSEHLVFYSDGAGDPARLATPDSNLDYSGDQADPPFEVGQTSVNNQTVRSGNCDDTNESETLSDHDDWSRIRINFRPSGEFGDAQGEVSDETGMVQEGEGELLNALAGRADLEVGASSVGVVDGVAEVFASLSILDRPEVVHPTISFELGDGVSVGSVPEPCSADDSIVVCEFTGLVSKGDPVEVVLPVLVADGAGDPSVMVVVTSDFNPVSNDPDPTNNTATVSVAGTSTGSAPVANGDDAEIDVGGVIEIDVLGNDSDEDGDLDPTSLVISIPPSLGAAKAENGAINYVAGAVPGLDSLTYQVCDSTGLCDSAVVTVTVSDDGGGESICDTLTPTIEGTEGSETINGTSGDDIIFAYGGDDRINGKGGNDIVCAGAGNDTINLKNGDDIVDTGPGDDKVNAKNGDNTIYALEGNNTINGGNGVDTVYAGSGDDTVNSKAGNDVVDAGAGDNTVNASSGDDSVTTGSGVDLLNLGAGDDFAVSGSGDDRINAGSGNDTVDAGDGIDTCFGEENAVSCEL